MSAEPAGATADVVGAIVEVIRSGRRFVVTGHMNPDGDVAGSMSALGCLLTRLGKEVVVYDRDPMSEQLSFLPLSSDLVTELPEGERFDAAFLVDCADPERVSAGFAARVPGARLIALDHHPGAIGAVDVVWHDTSASAVGVLVYRLAAALGVEVDAEIGQGIYVSIVTDTGSFRYSNTNEEAHAIAGELLRAGVDGHRVASCLYEAEPLARLKALGLALSCLELSDDGRVAWMVLSPDVLEANGSTAEMLDGVVDYGRQVRGVEVACMVRASRTAGLFRVSMRSRGRIDVEVAAASLGGGGHRYAAGCELPAPSLEAALERVRAAVQAVLPP